MANHVAEQIVAAAVTALTGLTTTGARVFDSRVYPVKETDCPCLLIDQGDESIAGGELFGFSRSVERTLELLVIAKVEQNTSYRTLVNTIRKEVEVALAANQAIGGAKWVQPASCLIELSGEGEKPIASGTMTFEVHYITALNAPDAAL
jgi:hypothetical protein